MGCSASLIFLFRDQTREVTSYEGDAKRRLRYARYARYATSDVIEARWKPLSSHGPEMGGPHYFALPKAHLICRGSFGITHGTAVVIVNVRRPMFKLESGSPSRYELRNHRVCQVRDGGHFKVVNRPRWGKWLESHRRRAASKATMSTTLAAVRRWRAMQRLDGIAFTDPFIWRIRLTV